METSLVSPVLYGLLFSSAFSLLLGVHSKRTLTEITHPLFGLNSAQLLNYIIIFLGTIFVVIAAVFSVMIEDTKYPNEHPLNFTAETAAMALFPSLMIFILFYFRNKPITHAVYVDYVLLCVKFGLAHLLFQFSGIYTSVFGL
jgi:hypothetical protein